MKDEEMAEQKAEKYAKNLLKDVTCNIGHPKARQINSIDIEDAWLYGYKEGFKDCAKSRLNITTISDCPIKDEWHYVKNELPKESGKYLVWVGGVNGIFVLDFETGYNDFGYWCLQVGENLGVTDTVFETVTERNEDKVIAWKEIVLPELKESE